MKYIIYDIEVFPNLFLICFENYQTKEKFSIEVSPYKNEIHLIKPTFKRFLDKGYTLVAYNCLRYDWVVIDYIISTVLKKKSLTQGLFNSLVYIKSRETLNSHTK